MSSFNSYQYPQDGDPFSLPDNQGDIPITTEQVQRVQEYLVAARNRGIITQQDLEQRLSASLLARNRGELDKTYMDIQFADPNVNPASGSTNYQQAPNQTNYDQPTDYRYQAPYPVPIPPNQQSLAGARLAHLSGLISFFIGPGIAYVVSQKGTITHREAARAFNFQLTMSIGLVIGALLENASGSGLVSGVFAMMWLIGTLVGAFRIGNPRESLVDKLTFIKVLNDGKPAQPAQIDISKKND